MNWISRFLSRIGRSTPERCAQRAHLRAAKNEDAENYLALAANYTELALLYFGSSVHEPVNQRIDRVEQVFAGLWQSLPYAERLSDFEYMLTIALLYNTPHPEEIHSVDPLLIKLRQLPPLARFALVAYELGGWQHAHLAFILRISPNQLHQLLSEARCELCGISWDRLADEEKACLESISHAFDSRPNLRANRALSQRVSEYPRVSEIRADWLALRPHFVEIRYHYELSHADRETLLKEIYNAIDGSPMLRPPFMDRMINSVQFSRHRRFKVS
ncbi:MAG: hypothetical protein ACI81V_000121 [Lentimonas sp.]|jgi:hypothetical protein